MVAAVLPLEHFASCSLTLRTPQFVIYKLLKEQNIMFELGGGGVESLGSRHSLLGSDTSGKMCCLACPPLLPG
jgi:hypothetical protein